MPAPCRPGSPAGGPPPHSAAAVPLGAIAHLIPRGLDLSDPVAGFAAVARALSEPSGGRQRVLLVDDLQWLDAASAMLLRQLLDAGVVRLIGTMRTEDPVGAAVAAEGPGSQISPGRLSAAARWQDVTR